MISIKEQAFESRRVRTHPRTVMEDKGESEARMWRRVSGMAPTMHATPHMVKRESEVHSYEIGSQLFPVSQQLRRMEKKVLATRAEALKVFS